MLNVRPRLAVLLSQFLGGYLPTVVTANKAIITLSIPWRILGWPRPPRGRRPCRSLNSLADTCVNVTMEHGVSVGALNSLADTCGKAGHLRILFDVSQFLGGYLILWNNKAVPIEKPLNSLADTCLVVVDPPFSPYTLNSLADTCRELDKLLSDLYTLNSLADTCDGDIGHDEL